MLRKIKHIVEFVFVIQIFAWANILPYSWAMGAGRLLGRLMYRLWAYRRRIAKTNIRLCFPDMEEEEVDRVGRESFEHVVVVAIEMMRMWRLNHDNIRRYVTINNEECLAECKESGKGGVVITGHLGAYELSGVGIHLYGYDLSFVVGDQSNKHVDDMMNWTRKKTGVGIIHRDASSLRNIIHTLRKGGMVALVADQEAGDNGIKVDFFGHPISPPKGSIAFALKTKSAMCCAHSSRKDNRNIVTMEDIIWPTRRSENNEDDIRYWTQVALDTLERAIRCSPGEYMWMHKRFKTYMPEIYHNMEE
jgi:KDO2-lipid IV(A) lauroyltransferase